MFKCKICDWSGSHEELEVDSVETCFGNDQIDMCPSCGSYEIVKVEQERIPE